VSLAVCAVLALILVFLGRVQPTLFDRVRAYASDRAAPVLEVLRTPLRTATQWGGNLTNIFDVYQENLRLKEQNARLRQWQNAALALDQRLRRYQLLLKAVPDPELGSVTAHVIGRARRPFLDTMILDAGRRQQIKPGEAIVDDRGMIGRIFLAGDHTSWVILLTDLNSRIPVSIEPGNVQAIMAGDNSNAPTLEVSAQEVHLRDGQQVVTSGDGALLPAGLSIGKVYWDGNDFRVGLYADAGHSDDVRVLDLKMPVEKPPVPTTGDLPVVAAGLPPLSPPPPKPVAPLATFAPAPADNASSRRVAPKAVALGARVSAPTSHTGGSAHPARPPSQPARSTADQSAQDDQ
jgi:rod shape-determining protein MreC